MFDEFLKLTSPWEFLPSADHSEADSTHERSEVDSPLELQSWQLKVSSLRSPLPTI